MPRKVIISGNVYRRIRQYISYIITPPDLTFQVTHTRAIEKWNELISALSTKLGSDIMRFPPTQHEMLGKTLGCHQLNYKMKKSGTQFSFGIIEDNSTVLVNYMENAFLIHEQRRKITLTESQLNKLISTCVKRVLKVL